MDMTVHPRVCGERRKMKIAAFWKGGSSPRVRGTPQDENRRLLEGRFIPACAGNASSGRIRSCLRTVHPRVCGERAALAGWLETRCGSSPRVRGTQTRDLGS